MACPIHNEHSPLKLTISLVKVLQITALNTESFVEGVVHFKIFVWSSLNYISPVFELKPDYYICVHSLLKWLAHFLLHKNVEMIWIKHFYSQQNKAIFHIINQIKVLRVPLLNGHAPLNTWNYKEGLLIFKRMRLFLFTFIVFGRTVNLPLSQE